METDKPVAIFIGIDPGSSSGGIAVIECYEGGNNNCYAKEIAKMTDKDIAAFFQDMRVNMELGIKVKAIIEKVHAVFGSSAKAMFSFGGNFHSIQMAMICNKISFEFMLPAMWMKDFGMKKEKGEVKTVWKKRLRQRAEQIFPDATIVTNTSDAVLIAEFCRRKHQ